MEKLIVDGIDGSETFDDLSKLKNRSHDYSQ